MSGNCMGGLGNYSLGFTPVCSRDQCLLTYDVSVECLQCARPTASSGDIVMLGIPRVWPYKA